MTDTRTHEAILEALDFDHGVPCENGSHSAYGDGPSIYVIHERPHGACSYSRDVDLFMCAGCWTGAGRDGCVCTGCGSTAERDEVWRIVRVIGGAR